jgi:hypothetical protein
MPTIQEIRQKYPQYKDMSDEQLAHGLHDKYYADMPFDDFASRIGLKSQTPATQEPVPQPRSTWDDIKRQAALGVRNVTEGAMALPSIASDAVKGVGNAALALEDKLRGSNQYTVTLDDGSKVVRQSPRFGSTMQELDQGLTNAGLPQPQNRTEEVAGTLTRGLAGVGSGLGLGGALAGSSSPVVSGIGNVLESRPLVQTLGAVTGGLSSEAAKEAGAGQTGQTIAGLAGGMAPGFIGSGAPMSVRGVFRGGEQGRQQVADNLQTFERVGATPTVGQATQGRATQGLESLLSRTPGAAGRMTAKAETQAQDLSDSIEQRAAQLMKKTSGEQAGRQIEKSIRGEGGFMDRFKAQQGKLYDQLDEHVPKDTRVDVTNTKEALQALNADIPGAPAVSEFFKNAKIKGIEAALKSDTEGLSSIKANPEYADAFKNANLSKEDAGLLNDFLVDGKLPYEALKKLRTLVGNEITDSNLASDVPRSKWKALYGALSSDMGKAVEGNPKAQAAWIRANNYTKAGMARIDSIESVIDKNGGPEAIFRAATANTKEGASTLRAVMQSVDDSGKKMISATVLRRLGIAKPGAQNELGEKFSTETFLTNWNNLSKEAKATLFDRYGPKFRDDIDQIAKVTSNLREGSKVFRNPSGTEQASAQAATVGGFAISALTGQYKTAAGIASIAGLANLNARLMTNPNFVRWLAQSTKHPLAHTPSMINSLAQRARDTGDEDLAKAAALLEQNYGKDDKNKNR